MGGRGAVLRVCAIFGTEFGGSKNALKVIVKKFNDQAKGAFEIGDIMDAETICCKNGMKNGQPTFFQHPRKWHERSRRSST